MNSLLDRFSKLISCLATIAGVISVSVLLLMWPSAAMSQNDVGSVVGFITDPTGAVIPGAKVTIVNEGTSETRNVATDAQGHYAVPNLPPAIYAMKATAGASLPSRQVFLLRQRRLDHIPPVDSATHGRAHSQDADGRLQ